MQQNSAIRTIFLLVALANTLFDYFLHVGYIIKTLFLLGQIFIYYIKNAN